MFAFKNMPDNLKKFFKSPRLVFLASSLLFLLFLFYKVHLQLPDFYLDREAAFEFVQTLDPHFDVNDISKKFGNPIHPVYNFLFKILAINLSFLLFVLIFNIKKWRNFKNIALFKNVIFVILWINISYILMCGFHLASCEADIGKHVYHSGADSMGIPYFMLMGLCFVFSFVYYPCVNLLFYIIYMTRFKNVFYSILCYFAMVPILLYLKDLTFNRIFIWQDVLGYFYLFVWIGVFVGAIQQLKYKRVANSNKIKPSPHNVC